MFSKIICVCRVHFNFEFHKLVQNFADVLLKQIQNLQNFVKIAHNDSRFCCEHSADCCKMTKEIPYEFEYFVKSLHFFLKCGKKINKSFENNVCNSDVFFCFRFANLVSTFDKISQNLSKLWSFFSKIVQSCNPFSRGHSGVCCTETLEIVDESVHFQNVCNFFCEFGKKITNVLKNNLRLPCSF